MNSDEFVIVIVGRRKAMVMFVLFVLVLRLVESISLIFLHVATTTSPSAIDDRCHSSLFSQIFTYGRTPELLLSGNL